jgi:endonuclease YncB( thermonuclease family)
VPFYVIKGSFRLCGQSKSGAATGFQPDGDSMQFKPENKALLDKLEVIDKPPRLTSIGSTQLRFEGIDALELHFDGRHRQPPPLPDEARDYLTALLGMNPVTYKADGVTVQPPAAHDGTAGFILSRALDEHGRPVAFAFAGAPPDADGTKVTLKSSLLKKSLNYKLLASGNAYPLFYDTLFAALRVTFTDAATKARAQKSGLWADDKTTRGLKLKNDATLEQTGVIFPKLYRRLTSYFTSGQTDPAGFLPWLAKTKEQVLDLTSGNFTHFDNVLAFSGGKIRLIRQPDELVFVSAKSASVKVAPWLAH